MPHTFEPAPVAHKVQNKIELVNCSKCKSEWFEQVLINQYKADHIVIPGQGVPAAGLQPYVLLRCIKCTALHTPIVLNTTQDQIAKAYNKMLDDLEDAPKA
jgi:hypothetical protein